jgi:hypothetical protein
MPFRAEHPQPFNGTGPAFHFLVGNVLALHTGLKEMRFGWRVKKIFPAKVLFQRYCRDAANKLDLVQVSRSRQVRLWIHGIFSDQSVKLHFFDGQMPDSLNVPANLIISIDDGGRISHPNAEMDGIYGVARAHRAGPGSAVTRSHQS